MPEINASLSLAFVEHIDRFWSQFPIATRRREIRKEGLKTVFPGSRVQASGSPPRIPKGYHSGGRTDNFEVPGPEESRGAGMRGREGFL